RCRRSRELFRQHVEPFDHAIERLGACSGVEAGGEDAARQREHQPQDLIDPVVLSHETKPRSHCSARSVSSKTLHGYFRRFSPTKKLPMTRLTGEPTTSAVWLARRRYSS